MPDASRHATSRSRRPRPTRSGILARLLVGVVLVLVATGLVTRWGAASPVRTLRPPPPTGLVPAAAHDPRAHIERHGNLLTLDGRRFTFVGLDAYELGTWWGQDGGCGADFDTGDLDRFFSSIATGSVVRTWAWQGAVGTNPSTHRRTWAPLDRLVSIAHRHGDFLVLSLSSQDGTCDDGHWHGPGWYTGGSRLRWDDDGRGLDATSYDTWVRQVVARYRGNPTIAMWEPVNEPEASTCPPGVLGTACYGRTTCPDEHAAAVALRTFFDQIGGEIHRLDPGSLVESGTIGSGQCGTAGADWAYVGASPGLDVLSVHDYGDDSVALPGDRYNGEALRLAQSRADSKPVIIGEVGIEAGPAGSGCATPGQRLGQLAHKISVALGVGYSGALVWDWVPTPHAGCTLDVGPGDPFMALQRLVGVGWS